MSSESWFLIRVIDIETTGIDPAADAIIEIASVDMVRRHHERHGHARPPDQADPAGGLGRASHHR
jgi:DNA polymerase III epsilon subunit-like protein